MPLKYSKIGLNLFLGDNLEKRLNNIKKESDHLKELEI
ncbi:hypothetical protein J2756_000249 [Methanobacterium aggregans]|nr:hypothetical protein [Methanobacterium aggregans]